MRSLIIFVLVFSIPGMASETSNPHSDIYVNSLIKKSREKKLSQQKKWLKLVHYKEKWFGGYEGQADGEVFYTNQEEGKTNPQAELESTIQAFFVRDGEMKDNHALCRFPARFEWLAEELAFDLKKIPQVRCEKFLKFLSYHQVQSASLVFSSYHLDSPASAFGHTLLRLNKGPHARTGKVHELLDMGINFAAQMTTSNPILYSILGFSGGFNGIFSSVPYYYKIREYNDFEARDLWAYDLNLNAKEVQTLIFHLWEVGQTYFDYYYLTENCSYHMLTVLEAVNPKWELVSQLPFYIIPVETIKAVMNVPGLVKKVSYRPSVQTRFAKKYEKLSSKERVAFQKVVDEKSAKSLKSLSVTEKQEILDASIDYVDMKYAKEILIQGDGASIWKEDLLASRADLGIVSKYQVIPPAEDRRPDHGHGSRRSGFGFGDDDGQGSFQTIQMRFALHDLLDSKLGQPELAQLEFMKLDFHFFNQEKKLRLNDASLVEIVNLRPWTDLTKKMSLRVKIGGETQIMDSEKVSRCDGCFAPNLEFGMGPAFQFKSKIPMTIYMMAAGDIAIHKDLHKSAVQLAYGPSANILFHWSDKLFSHLGGKYFLIPTLKGNTYWETKLETRYHFNQSFALNLVLNNKAKAWENSINGYFYF